MFSRFSEEAQKALIYAKKEMNNLRHPYVGSETFVFSNTFDERLGYYKGL